MPRYPTISASRFRDSRGTASSLEDRVNELYDIVDRLGKMVPIGTVILTYLPNNPAPEYFLPMNGQGVAVADYPALAKACPFMVSSTDATILIIPDERGKFPQFTPNLQNSQSGQTDNQKWQSGTGHSVDNLYLTPFVRAR